MTLLMINSLRFIVGPYYNNNSPRLGIPMLLVTYNIQYGTGKDGAVDLSRISSEVVSADVIAMQEVDRFWSRSNRLKRSLSGFRITTGYMGRALT